MNINNINDIFLIAEKQFLRQYPEFTEEDYKIEKDETLNELFSKKEIEEYNEFLK